jgi:hypothetical protein
MWVTCHTCVDLIKNGGVILLQNGLKLGSQSAILNVNGPKSQFCES